MSMKANQWPVISLFIILSGITGLSARAEGATYSRQADMAGEFIFIENNIDGNYFFKNTNGKDIGNDLRIQGSSIINTTNVFTWRNQVLANISTGNTISWSVATDAWLDNSPVPHPFTGGACSFNYEDCLANGGVIPATKIDEKGFYGADISSIDHPPFYVMASLSGAFIQYLRQLPTNGSFSSVLYECGDMGTKSEGATCRDKNNTVHVTNITMTKTAHLTLKNSSNVDEIFINSDGVPTIAEGNTDCKLQTIGSVSGVACKMLNYSIQTNGGNSIIHVYPIIFQRTRLRDAITKEDMQFSLDGNQWIYFNGKYEPYLDYDNEPYYYTLEDLASSDAMYIFFSENFFKQMLALKMSDTNAWDLVKILLSRSLTYQFTSSNSLLIKPREFSINISSEDYSDVPSREGYVGSNQPSLDFNYIVTTTGKTSADEVLIKATGPTQQINGRAHCIFSADDGSIKVPFPATLSFTKQDGSINIYDVGCDGSWRDMTDALWLTSAWTDISQRAGVMDKATVKFSIPMNDDISQKTLDNNEWYGDVSASGEIHVQATWRDIN